MGITPDISFREKKHSLKTVGLMVVACLRMKRMPGSVTSLMQQRLTMRLWMGALTSATLRVRLHFFTAHDSMSLG